MARSFRQLTDFLVAEGTAAIPHSGTHFLSHLVGVYRDLKEWGCPEYLCLAGLFHSIYGTQAFQGFALPLERRGEIRDLIGEQAERIAYINCALTYESLDSSVAAGGAPQLRNRFTGEPLPVTGPEYRDLLTLHLCDRLEQAGRSQDWGMRRDAWENMAKHLGGIALERWQEVYAAAPPR
jgi:hypothetical protein